MAEAFNKPVQATEGPWAPVAAEHYITGREPMNWSDEVEADKAKAAKPQQDAHPKTGKMKPVQLGPSRPSIFETLGPHDKLEATTLDIEKDQHLAHKNEQRERCQQQERPTFPVDSEENFPRPLQRTVQPPQGMHDITISLTPFPG